MNIFETILQKVGLGKPAPTQPGTATIGAAHGATISVPTPPVKPVATVVGKPEGTISAPVTPAKPVAATVAPTPVKPVTANVAPTPAKLAAIDGVVSSGLRPVAVSVVDVVSKLEGMTAQHPGLDWKVSIVDLLKLLEIDSSLEARKELAAELDCPAHEMGDSARMNIWLHKAVLQKIAENGGNIPDSLLD